MKGTAQPDTSAEQPEGLPGSPRKSRRWGKWLLVLVVLALIGLFLALRSSRSRTSAAQTAAAKVHPAVPVSVAVVKKGELNHYVTAIGTVSAYNTVTVKSRVDGELVQVAFKEGQLVKKGDPLAVIDPRPYQVQLKQAEGQLAKDQAQATDARLTLARDRVLFKNNVLARQDLDNAQASLLQDEGGIKTDQASVDNAKLQLTYTRITAPITGRIGLRLVDQGNMIHASDAQGLAVITELQPIAVLFSIPEDDLPMVVKATRANGSVPVIAYNRDFKTKLAEGKLLTFDNQIDQTTGTVKLKSEFANEDGSLFPNQFVNINLLVDTKVNAILLPVAAIQRSQQGSIVYVVQQNGTVQARQVKVGLVQGETAAVDSGVQEGDQVVVEGLDRLQPGTRVSVQYASQNSAREPQ